MKHTLRQDALARRNAHSANERKAKSLLIQKNLLALEEFRKAKTIMAYASFGSEVETRTIIEKAVGMGKRVALPLVGAKERKMDLVLFRDFKGMKRNRFGIPEPIPEKGFEVKAPELDLVLVPGLLFDEAGNRIGFGKAYYDNFLNSLKGRAPLIALAFEFQVAESVPREGHDVQMDKIVTEKRVIKCNGC